MDSPVSPQFSVGSTHSGEGPGALMGMVSRQDLLGPPRAAEKPQRSGLRDTSHSWALTSQLTLFAPGDVHRRRIEARGKLPGGCTARPSSAHAALAVRSHAERKEAKVRHDGTKLALEACRLVKAEKHNASLPVFLEALRQPLTPRQRFSVLDHCARACVAACADDALQRPTLISRALMLWTTALDLKDDESGQPVGETHARSRLALRCAELLEGEQRFAAAIRMYTRCVHIDDNPFSPYSKAAHKKLGQCVMMAKHVEAQRPDFSGAEGFGRPTPTKSKKSAWL